MSQSLSRWFAVAGVLLLSAALAAGILYVTYLYEIPRAYVTGGAALILGLAGLILHLTASDAWWQKHFANETRSWMRRHLKWDSLVLIALGALIIALRYARDNWR